MSNFKVGDRVISTDGALIGKKGIVKKLTDANNVKVLFDNHLSDLTLKFSENLKLDAESVSTTPEEITFEVGDEVEMLHCTYHGTIGIISEIFDTTSCYVLNDNTKHYHKGLGYLKNNSNLILIKKHKFNNSNQSKNHEQTKINDSGQSVNLSRTSTTVTRGKNLIGSSIKGRRSRITITIGSYCNQAISC